MRWFRLIWLIGLLLPGLAALGVDRGSVRGIRSGLTRPVAMRGGVLLLPLGAVRPGSDWPKTLTLRWEGAKVIKGQVIWIERTPPPSLRHWTDDPRHLRVRAVRKEDDSSKVGAGRPYLLAALPPSGKGSLTLSGSEMSPIWCDSIEGALIPRPGIPSVAPKVMMPRMRRDDRPDPDSPFEYWRWVVLADRQGLVPPPADNFGETGSLLARHYADLWRVGLSRLAKRHPGVAAQCRDLLTEICRDGEHSFACWTMSPGRTGGLLSILLDFERDEDQLAQDALDWSEAAESLLAWPEGEDVDGENLVVVNAGSRPETVRFTWTGAGENESSIPIAVRAPARSLVAVPLYRPHTTRLPAPPDAGAIQVVGMTVGGWERSFTFAAGPRLVIPPGAFFPPFRPSLSLYEVEQRRLEAVGPSTRTNLHLRRRERRWEVFFECFRELEEEDGGPSEESNLHGYESLEDIRGVEAVVLQIEVVVDEERMRIVLVIPERGAHRLFAGRDDGSLEVHRSSRRYADRWYCRVVLPEAWLSPDPTRPTLVLARRIHAGIDRVDYCPRPTAPWRINTAYAAIDLTGWEDLPRGSGE